jgi:GH15 family glucan-1,4-alpha-glucosidase
MDRDPMRSTLELGVIGNCEVSALIDRAGNYAWMCLPRPDGDPVFCTLLRDDAGDHAAGFFAIDLEGLSNTEQHYERNTAVLETTLTSHDGSRVGITDFCPRFRQFGRNYRPVMAIRIVRPLAGRPVIRVRLRPMCDYGLRRPATRAGSHHVRFEAASYSWRLTTDMPLNVLMEERPYVLDEPLAFVLGADEPVTENIGKLAERFLDDTRRYWLDWTRELAVPFEWQSAVIRAAITLKLCTFEDTGAVLAALTTSIPEAANSGRNWDYRFCWLRDSYFTIHALNRLGATRTMEGYLRYINNIVAATRETPLQPVYGISGETHLSEMTLPHLAGYRGMGPVRIGNLAHEQVQHDVYGAVILAATQSFFDERLTHPGDIPMFLQLELAGAQCWLRYDQPDAGIWEYRGRARTHTFSSAMCWAGVDRLARIARKLELRDRAEFWQQRADVMRARIIDSTWDAGLGTFTEGWQVPSLDASALLLAELDLVAADDPRFVATVRHLGAQLRRGPYLLRYAAADDFGVPENAFNICTFWYINALASVGCREEAREIFENMLSRCNHLGMLSEDLDPATGELWGNYPQTYSMVGIINAAMRLSRTWESAL